MRAYILYWLTADAKVNFLKVVQSVTKLICEDSERLVFKSWGLYCKANLASLTLTIVLSSHTKLVMNWISQPRIS